jgi:hypothetical protein
VFQTETLRQPYCESESDREGGKVRKRTLANLSKLPDHAVNGLQALLKGDVTIASLPDSFKITRSRPQGHVAAVLGSLKNTGLHNLISSENTRNRRLVLAMIIARIIDPRSKLATAQAARLLLKCLRAIQQTRQPSPIKLRNLKKDLALPKSFGWAIEVSSLQPRFKNTFKATTSVVSIGLAPCVRYKSAAWSNKNRFNYLYLTNRTSRAGFSEF